MRSSRSSVSSRRNPAADRGVELRSVDVGLARALAAIGRAKCERVLQYFCRLRIAPRFLDDVEHDGKGAAAQATLGGLDPQPDTFQRLAELFSRGFLQKPDAHIRWNRIEAAAVHDPRPALAGGLCMLLDHLAHPRHFAGKVAVVGPVGTAGGNQLRAVQRVWPNGGADDPCALDQSVQRFPIMAIGDDQWQRGSAVTEAGPDLLQLGLAAA